MLDPVGCAAPTVFGVGDSARLFGFVVSWTAMLRGGFSWPPSPVQVLWRAFGAS